MTRTRMMSAPAMVAIMMLAAGCRTGAGRTAKTDAGELHEAVHGLSRVIVYDIMSPPQSSRVYAYASVAAYETLRQGHPEYRSLAGQLHGLAPVPAPVVGAEYDWPAAGVEAFLAVGRALVFSQERLDSLRLALREKARARGVPATVLARSVAYGDSVGEHVLAWSRTDNYLQTRGYPKFTVTTAPGRWVPTPPAYMDAVEANWRALRAFVLDSSSAFLLPRPATFDSTPGSAFYRGMREVYDARVHLTDEQRAIAAFWDCNPYVMNVQGHAMFATKKISPGGHWMEIIGLAARKADADIMQSAEAYARGSIAMADAFIATWDEKYRSAVIRPETVINRYLDERWEPLLQTPPFPEYPSGHSVVSTAVAVVLTEQFGRGFAFADSAEMEYGLPVRRFTSFDAAAREASISRLYGGIHYRASIERGQDLGQQVGKQVLARVRTRGGPTSVVADRGS